ncbi:MAG: preprotein translocase subunit SecG [Geobacteraceae bacterium]|nr:preprotein translocase subunit SecG [Geobacteraceae bacterium]
MYYAIVFLHVFVSIAMIGIVLLQSGKGAEMGASFGAGGSQTVFGASGGNTFMNKLTTGAAIIFMLTSLSLAHLSSSGNSSSIMSGKKAPAAPAQQSAPAAPAAPQGAAPAQPMQAPAAPAAPVK